MQRSIAIAAALALVAVTGALPSRQDDAAERPRILVTNDDGIQTPGLHALVTALATFADVTVCAPESQRSGASQSVTYFSYPIAVKEIEIEGAVRAILHTGTPADCVHFGMMQHGRDTPFDLVISGINHGWNVGDLSHGSGTVGAAMEGAYHGIPSIAVSMEGSTRDLAKTADFVAKFAQEHLEQDAGADVVFSINIPAPGEDGWKGVRPAPMGGSFITIDEYREFRMEDGKRTFRAARRSVRTGHPPGSDTDLLHQGYITITPLRFDWTHHEALAELATWDLE